MNSHNNPELHDTMIPILQMKSLSQIEDMGFLRSIHLVDSCMIICIVCLASGSYL